MSAATETVKAEAEPGELPVSSVPGFAIDFGQHLFEQDSRHAWFSLYTLLRGLCGSGNNGSSYVTLRHQTGGAGVAYSLAGESSAVLPTLREVAPDDVAAAVARIGRLFPRWALPMVPGDACDRIDAAFEAARAAKIAATAGSW